MQNSRLGPLLWSLQTDEHYNVLRWWSIPMKFNTGSRQVGLLEQLCEGTSVKKDLTEIRHRRRSFDK